MVLSNNHDENINNLQENKSAAERLQVGLEDVRVEAGDAAEVEAREGPPLPGRRRRERVEQHDEERLRDSRAAQVERHDAPRGRRNEVRERAHRALRDG